MYTDHLKGTCLAALMYIYGKTCYCWQTDSIHPHHFDNTISSKGVIDSIQSCERSGDVWNAIWRNYQLYNWIKTNVKWNITELLKSAVQLVSIINFITQIDWPHIYMNVTTIRINRLNFKKSFKIYVNDTF